jgi:hypothetical protein
MELDERANKHFLRQLVSSLVWETRHWPNKMGLFAARAPAIGANPNSSVSVAAADKCARMIIWWVMSQATVCRTSTKRH